MKLKDKYALVSFSQEIRNLLMASYTLVSFQILDNCLKLVDVQTLTETLELETSITQRHDLVKLWDTYLKVNYIFRGDVVDTHVRNLSTTISSTNLANSYPYLITWCKIYSLNPPHYYSPLKHSLPPNETMALVIITISLMLNASVTTLLQDCGSQANRRI